MEKRIELHEILCTLLGSRNVYFQPPESVKLKFPAIVYKRKNIDSVFADNNVYARFNAYEVVVIDSDPDSEYVTKVSNLPRCRFERHYTADNLNHDAFTLYY